ncbi:hypothetical protein [Synechococcus sp. PCC 7336]|uniref:hypothetical protein n=1 Tax=Synechococcus sp. PCC 7336 TaxID=195250 RepID=UPI00034AA670|nr:hypothetical protein [Synechococcus sp. PCC 7336]
MTIAELIPTVKELSHTDQLLLLQVLVQELLQAEGVTEKQLLEGSSSQPAVSSFEDDDNGDLTLEERRDFLEKPLVERRRILAEQAEAIQTHYEQNTEWKEWLAGDIVEY